MQLFTTPSRASYPEQQSSYIPPQSDFDFDFPSTPLVSYNMKTEFDDFIDAGVTYGYSSQPSSVPTSTNSSFSAPDFEHCSTPASSNSFGHEWLMTPESSVSSRRPSVDTSMFGDIDGTSSLRISMSASPEYSVPKGYCDVRNFTLPHRPLTYSTPVKPARNVGGVLPYGSQSVPNTMYSDYPESFADSFQNEASPVTHAENSQLLHQPLQPYHFNQSFVNPAQIYYLPAALSTPFQTPTKPLQGPFESYDDHEQAGIPYFMSPTPSHAPSPPRSSTKRRRGDTTATRPRSSTQTRDSKPPKSGMMSDISVVRKPEFFCHYPTCHKNPDSEAFHALAKSEGKEHNHSKGVGFRRQEHLKRHLKTHEADNKIKCPFCKKEDIDSRADNFKQHIKRHTLPNYKGKRVPYVPAAQAYYEGLDAQTSRPKKRKMKAESEEKDADGEDDEDSEYVHVNDFGGGDDESKLAEVLGKYEDDDDDNDNDVTVKVEDN